MPGNVRFAKYSLFPTKKILLGEAETINLQLLLDTPIPLKLKSQIGGKRFGRLMGGGRCKM